MGDPGLPGPQGLRGGVGDRVSGHLSKGVMSLSTVPWDTQTEAPQGQYPVVGRRERQPLCCWVSAEDSLGTESRCFKMSENHHCTLL